VSERVSVIVPNWDGLRWLERCLTSLRTQTFRDFKVYLVDNGSADGSVAFVTANFPEVAVLALPRNIGFAGGVNAGFRAAAGEFLVPLNNDTEADLHWLERLVEAADRNPRVGMLASQIMDFTDRTRFDCLGDGYSRLGMSNKIAAGLQDIGAFSKPFEVFGACAAACLYRRSMLDDIGLYDEDFFAYMEDVELSVRARLAGYLCLAVPGATVFHVGSATHGGTASGFSVRLTTRNIYAIIARDIPVRVVPRMLLGAVAAQLAVVVLALVGRKSNLRPHLGAFAKGLIDAVRVAPAMVAKRGSAPVRIGPHAFMKLATESDRLRTRLTGGGQSAGC
jgi:GT2 family glycosyltransferase